MSKKFLALMVTGVLAAGFSTAAFADETEAVDDILEYDYTMIEGAFEGTWLTAFDVFDLYLPSDWNVVPDDELEENVYFQAVNDDQTESAAISYAESDYVDITEVADAYAALDGFTNIEIITMNDIYCVSYEYEDEDAWTAGLVALGDQGGLYNVTVGCSPELKEEFTPIAADILLSFSVTETVEETEA